MNNLAMKKRVYGAIGVKATMAAWNLGFDHAPKSLSNGTIYASDKSLKYSARRLWNEEGEKIIYFKIPSGNSRPFNDRDESVFYF